jgi:diguanylate cyclase (GGDEF)-like protein/PAS domain S-box-containing protein
MPRSTDAVEATVSAEALRALVDALPSAVLATGPDGRIQLANPAAAEALRRRPETLLGAGLADVLHLVDEHHRAVDLVALGTRLLQGGPPVRVAHATAVLPDGGELAVTCSGAVVAGRDGRSQGAVWVVHDVREERELRHHLSLQARQDPLTGLVNRPEFEHRLAHATASAGRGAEHALCFLDLDRFKAVNDRFGHAAGDALLGEIASLLLASIRGRDTLARLGGDEFGLLLEHCPLLEAARVAENLVASVRAYALRWGEERVQVGLSVGVVSLDRDFTAAEALAAADAACYRAKALGRGQVHVGPVGEAP